MDKKLLDELMADVRPEDLEKRGDGRVSTLIKLADALSVTLDELCRP